MYIYIYIYIYRERERETETETETEREREIEQGIIGKILVNATTFSISFGLDRSQGACCPYDL